MFFGNKYDVASIKKEFDRAAKSYNMKNVKSTDKEPAKQSFKTKVFYKLSSMIFKADSKAANSKNKKYYEQIDATNGDYSRRGSGVGEQSQAMYEYLIGLIKKNKDLQYTMIGVFTDTYENLKNMKWRAAYKISFDYVKKEGGNRSLANAFKTMYTVQVFALEAMMLKLVKLTYDISNGISPIESIIDIHYSDREFMDKVVIPTINMNALIKSTDDPVKMVRSYISGEKNSKKATEGFGLDYNPMTSEEGAFFEGLKRAGGATASIILSGLTVAGAIAGVVVTGGAVAIASLVISSIIFLFVLIPNIRLIIYYAYAAEVDMIKELELNKEMLNNNIAVLKEKYANLPEGKEKQKLGEVIAKQEAFYKDIVEKLDKYKNVSSYAVEGDLDSDENASDKEANDQGKDTNTDGDEDGGYSIEI